MQQVGRGCNRGEEGAAGASRGAAGGRRVQQVGRGCSRWEGKLIVAYGTKGNDKLLGGYDPAFLLTIPATQPHTHQPNQGKQEKREKYP